MYSVDLYSQSLNGYISAFPDGEIYYAVYPEADNIGNIVCNGVVRIHGKLEGTRVGYTITRLLDKPRSGGKDYIYIWGDRHIQPAVNFKWFFIDHVIWDRCGMDIDMTETLNMLVQFLNQAMVIKAPLYYLYDDRIRPGIRGKKLFNVLTDKLRILHEYARKDKCISMLANNGAQKYLLRERKWSKSLQIELSG